MKVIYIQDQQVVSSKGKVYHEKSEHFFERFLAGLNNNDSLVVYTGLKEELNPEAVRKYKCVSNDRIKFVGVPEFRKLKNLYKIYRQMKKAVKEADFCYLRCGIASSFAGLFCKRYNVPYMTIVNEDIFKSTVNHSSLIVRLSAYPLWFSTRYVVRNANYSCYVTKEYLQSKYPCRGKSLGCSDIEFLNIDDAIIAQRQDKIVKMQVPIILGSVGSVSTVIKGHDTAIKALAKLKEEGHVGYIYQIVGTGDPSRLKALAEQCGVVDMVKFMGVYKHEDVLKWFEDIDIYLHPSRSEGLPRTIIEAMTKATPCVCSKVGGIPELISSEFLFAYDGKEVESLKDSILRLTRERMISEGEKNYYKSKQYEPKRLEKIRHDFFEEAIESHRKM